MQITHLDAWVATIYNILLQAGKRCKCRLKLKVNRFTSHAGKAINQPIETVYRNMQICKRRELSLQSEITESFSKGDQKWNILRQRK